jgi:hypothetical protein
MIQMVSSQRLDVMDQRL